MLISYGMTPMSLCFIHTTKRFGEEINLIIIVHTILYTFRYVCFNNFCLGIKKIVHHIFIQPNYQQTHLSEMQYWSVCNKTWFPYRTLLIVHEDVNKIWSLRKCFIFVFFYFPLHLLIAHIIVTLYQNIHYTPSHQVRHHQQKRMLGLLKTNIESLLVLVYLHHRRYQFTAICLSVFSICRFAQDWEKLQTYFVENFCDAWSHAKDWSFGERWWFLPLWNRGDIENWSAWSMYVLCGVWFHPCAI